MISNFFFINLYFIILVYKTTNLKITMSNSIKHSEIQKDIMLVSIFNNFGI